MSTHPLWSARMALAVAVGIAMFMATPSDRGGAQGPPTEILTFASIADTYVDEAGPNTNFNTNTRLRVDARSKKIVFLRFAVTGIGGRTVEQARVQLRVSSASTVTGGTIHRIGSNTWNEATVTWSTRPPVDGPGLHTLGPVDTGEIVEFLVDGAVTGDGLVSFAIDTLVDDGVSYDSAVTPGGQRPRLALTVSASPQPVVTIVQPPPGSTFFDGDAVPLQATVTDDADTDLAGEVQWTSDRDGSLGSGGTIAPMLSQGTHRVIAAVTDRDGFSGSDEVDLAVVPPPPANTEPLVSITAPLDGQVLNASEPVSFAGSATDLEDGALTSGLRWTSDRDGPIGQGGGFTRLLSQGRHQVTAAVTDRDGAPGAATVSFDMVPPISLEFAPVADTYVDAGSAGTNFGAGTLLRVDASSERITYLRFTVSGVGGRRVSRATLRLQAGTASTAASDSGGRVHRISTTTWQEGTVTWGTRPAVDGPPLSVAGRVNPGDIVDFDLTGAVTTDGTYNLALTTTSIDAVDYRSREGGSPRLTLLLGGRPPAVSITAPVDGTVVFTSALPLTFTGTAIDAEDGPLDANLAWSSDRDGPLGTGASRTAMLSVGTHRIRAAATDRDGLVGESTITVTVRAPNTPPVVTITAPTPGTAVPAGTLLTVAATATDAYDGPLSAQIAWRSNRDGALGTGATLAVRLSEGSHSLTASVTDSDGAPGSAQIGVTVQPTAPVVTITAPIDGTRIFVGQPLALAATASDATEGDLSAQLGWTSDRNGALGTGASLTTTTLNQGTHRLTARVVDRGGLAGTASVTVVVRPPNVVPQVTITAPTDGTTLLLPLALAATASDAEDGDLGASIVWRSDRDGALGTGATVTAGALAPGTHALTATVTDGDGTSASAGIAVTVVARTLSFAPVADTFVDAGTPNTAYGTDAALRIDASPVRQSFLRFVVSGVAPFAVERATLRLTVTAQSTDASVSGGAVHRVTNTTWPETTTTYTNRPTIDGPALATRGAISNGAVVDFDVTAALLRNGTHSFAIATTSSDAAGYRSRESTTGRPQLILALKLNTPPVVAITAPPTGTAGLPGVVVTLRGTASDADDGALTGQIAWMSSVQGALGTGGSVSFAPAPGRHTITATVTDSSGARSETAINLNIGQPPAVSITAPADGAVVFTSALPLALTATATDVEDGPLGAALTWSSDRDGPLGTGASRTAMLSIGTHRIRAAVTDRDGLVGESTITVTVRAPNTPPVVTITAPAPGTAMPAGTLLTLAATATDAYDGPLSAQISWRSDRDGALGTGATLAVRLNEGSHTLTASVTDTDGAPGSAQLGVTVQPTAPVVTITAPADGTRVFSGQPLTLAATASDATDGDLSAQLGWTSDRGGAIGTGATLTISTLSVGTHRLTARVVDRGGLAGTATVTVVIRPPNVGPQVTITAPTAGTTLLPPLTLAATASDAEDGDLGASIGWRSDRDGALGTGATVPAAALTPGTHTLTATVTDRDGAAATASVTVDVRNPTLAFTAQADTCVDDSTPATTYGADTALRIDASPRRQMFMRFAVSGVPPFAVERAIVRLTVDAQSASGSTTGGTIHRISNSTWTEATTTYANRPAIDGAALATAGAVAPGGTVDFDVTRALGGDGPYDFALVTASSDAAGYRSRESAAGRPQLILTLKPNTLPVVSVTAPVAGAIVPPDTALVLGGTATDAENGDLTARIEWTSDRSGPLGIGGSVTAPALTPGAHVVTATVTDTSLARVAQTVPVVIESRPLVTITAPAPGSNHFVTEPVAFSASATDVGDGNLGASIAWTSSLDGPLGTGAQITRTSLRVGTHTVTAAATDSRGFVGSATVTLTVEVNDPPAVTIAAPAPLANFVQGRSVTFQATASDPEQGDLSTAITWTSSRDGALGTGGTLSTTRLSVGTHVITARVADNRNLQGTATVAVTVEVNDPPLVTIAAPANNAIAHMAAPVAFSATAVDPEDGNLTTNLTWTSSRDGALGSGAGFTTSGLSIGTHVITAAAVDTLGLSGSRQISLQVVNDVPVVTVTAPSSGLDTFVGNPIVFSATALDTEDGDIGTGLVWTSSRDGTLGSGPGFMRTTLSAGVHTTTARVTDRGGATGQRQLSITVRNLPAGTAAPVVNITAPGDGAVVVFGDPIAFTVTATDPDDGNIGASVVWRSSVNGTLGTGPSLVRSNLSIAVHRITATATDRHGVVRFDEITLEVEEPNEPPVVTITAPAGGTQVNERDLVTLRASAVDFEEGDLSSRIEWGSDVDGPLGSGTTLTLSTLTPGTHVVTAAAIDGRGDVGAASVTLTVHAIPVVAVLIPIDGVGYLDSTPLSFFATAMDAADGDVSASLVWTSNVDGPIGLGESFTTDSLRLGFHTVTAMATNSRGGIGTGTVTFFIGRDTLLFAPIADTYVDQGSPTANFGTGDLLFADAGPQVRESYFRFAVSGIGPLDIELADLRLTVSGTGGSSFGGRVHAFADTGWQERTVTYNTRPPVTGPALDVVGVSVEADEFVDFDITPAISGDGTYTLALQTDSTDAVKYKSREAADGRPELLVQVAPPELEEIPAVTILSPASSITVFDDTPVELVATASDAEDGNLTGSITWRSSRDGVLGTGGSLSAALSRGIHTITARVEDSFGLSATDTVPVTIVDRPPLVTITAPGDGAFFPAGMTVALRGSASDDLDGGLSPAIQWTSSRDGLLGTGPSPTAAGLARGDHRITATVVNSLGTVGSATIRIVVDQAPPELTMLVPADGTIVSEGSPFTLAGLATDVENGDLSASILWSSDRQGALGTGASVPASLMVLGSHHITAAVTDSHGFTATAGITVTVAAAPPAVTILSPAAGGEFTGPVAFQGTALDARDGNLSSGIAWRSSLGGALGTGASLPARQLANGVHVVTAQVTDSHGLVGSATASIVVGAAPPTVRITAPVSSTVSSPQASATLGAAVTFTATATASGGANLGSSVQWRSSLSGTLGTGASLTTSSLLRGRHIITARATDANGISAQAEIVVTVTGTVANAAPVVAITRPAGGTIVGAGNQVTFTATAVDDHAGNIASGISWVSSLEGLLGTGASVTTPLYRLGTHTVRAMAADGAGLVGSATVNITVERPSLTFDAVADTYTDSAAAITPFGAATTLRVDSTPEQRTYLRFAASGLDVPSIQSAVVRLQVSSQSGASSSSGGEIRRVGDVTWDEQTLTHVSRPPPNGAVLASAGSVATSETVDFDVTPTVTGDGIYSFAVIARSTDNVIYQSREASVGRPQLVVFVAPPARPAPIVDITAPANFATLTAGTPTTFRATATDAAGNNLAGSVTWTSDVSGTLGIGAAPSLTLSPGPHIVTASVTDLGGNVASDRIHVMVGNGPRVQITSPADDATVPFGQRIVFTGAALDLQGADVSASIQWSSSRDGALASGPSFAGTLSPGTHTITASATDSSSRVGTTAITLTVTIGTVGFRGASFGSGIDTENNRLTAAKPESKLWYTPDGAWWGVLYKRTAAAFRIHRLDFPTQTWIDTGTFVDERSNTRQDALLDGNTLYILSRFGDAPAENRLLRYTYHPVAQTWALDPGFPAATPGGGTEAATIAKDSTGTLWIAFTLNDQVWVSHTLGTDRDWAEAFLVPVRDENPDAVDVSFDDITGIIALNGRIGVFWSNQLTKRDYFAVHLDGAAPAATAAWSLETAASGGSIADDHFNMKLAADGRLFVAVKTSFTSTGQTLVGLLVRSATGSWSALHNVARVEQNPTRPLCLLDELRRRVHVFYSLNASAVYMKTSSMDTIAFPDASGPGTPFISSSSGDINNPTSTKQTVTSSTGYVALASSPDSHFYWHNDLEPRSAPAVTITQPADGSKIRRGASASFAGTAFSYNDGPASGSLVWTSNRDGVLRTAASFSTSTLSEGVHVITATLTDSMGATGSRSITITVETDRAPVVLVATPATGRNFAVGEPIVFSGTAADSLDGTLTAAIQWISSRDGVLGTGGTISRSNLSTGTHTITAQATDSAGLVGSASVSIGIQSPTVPAVQISAPASGTSIAFGAALPFAGTAIDAFDGDVTAALRWFSSRDGAIGAGGGFTRSSLSRGTHTITATVTDSHGLTGAATVTVIVN